MVCIRYNILSYHNLKSTGTTIVTRSVFHHIKQNILQYILLVVLYTYYPLSHTLSQIIPLLL